MKKLIKWIIEIFLCKIFYRVKFIGVEKLKQVNRCVICPNHSNTVEPAWIYAKCDNIAIMAKAELFENKFLDKIFRYFDVFPIHRGEHDVRSLIHAINLFKNVDKRKLLVFPEGERLKKHQDRIPAKVGPIYIAAKVNVPIMPVYISKNVKLFSKVYVIFGDLIEVSKDDIKDKKALNEKANEIMDEVYNLKNTIKE